MSESSVLPSFSVDCKIVYLQEGVKTHRDAGDGGQCDSHSTFSASSPPYRLV